MLPASDAPVLDVLFPSVTSQASRQRHVKPVSADRAKGRIQGAVVQRDSTCLSWSMILMHMGRREKPT